METTTEKTCDMLTDMEMEEEFDKTVLRWASLVLMLLIGLALGYGWRMLQTPAGGGIEYRQTFASEAARVEFNRRLAYHGLNHDVSIVYEDHLGPYFIRDGRRVAFK